MLLHLEALSVPKKCFDGKSRRKPYFQLGDFPRSYDLKLLEREYSQSVHFGFALGLNVFHFSDIELSNRTVYIPGQGNTMLYANITQAIPGFNISAVIDYRLVKNLSIRTLPGIFFGQRKMNFYRQDTYSLVTTMPISSNYVEVPTLLKYSAIRFTNFRPYLIGGLNTRVNLNNKPSDERPIGLVKLEFFGEIGFGFDFYFEYFRMGTELKFSRGLNNALSNQLPNDKEYYMESLKGLRSNMLVFTLSFEL